ncbi:MAG: hypothetical protein AB7T49_14900 [Oligoflexales bacterium]
MNSTSEIQIDLTNNTAHTDGTAALNSWTKKQAISKGLKWMAACWGMALVAIPIPIVHFVAVPVCLLAGPLVGNIVYRVHNGATIVEVAKGPCPSCGKDLEIKGLSAKWPVTTPCTSCEARITLTPKA